MVSCQIDEISQVVQPFSGIEMGLAPYPMYETYVGPAYLQEIETLCWVV